MRPMLRSTLFPAALLLVTGLGGFKLDACTPEELTCEERLEASNDYVSSTLEQHLSCSLDTDCTSVYPGTGCRGACPTAVNVDGKDDVEAAVAYANETWCDTYIEDGCPYATPSCLQGVPKCDAGTCVLEVVWY